jgi:L-threonylcarbamoyladenylate synthase
MKTISFFSKYFRATYSKSFKEISPIKGVDYVVNLQRDKIAGKPSTIIKLTNDSQVKVIRK